jgi:CDP-diglyceride synthetase
MFEEILLESEEKMEKAISSMENRFLNVRAGRANPKILDKVMVEYYGAPTPLRQLSQVSVQDGTTLVITVIAITMCTDVFAYLFGMAFHKGILASQISPKKSISGAIGGLFGGIIASAGVFLICYYCLNHS